MLFESLARKLIEWQQRRIAIQALEAMDDRILADMGTTREDIPCFVACPNCC